jgi:single-strand DNA-binding protein
MAGYNRIIMIGNLTKDPELKQLSSGQASGQMVCKLTLASNLQFKTQQGMLKQEVCYIDIDVWGAQANSCRQSLKKGSPLLVDGRLKLDTWKENDGQARSKHSIVADRIVFLAPRQGAEVASLDGLGSEEATMTAPIKKQSAEKLNNPKGALLDNEYGRMGVTDVFKDEPPFEDDLPF